MLTDLTDALSRGRLGASELAAISPMELDALFELGAEHIDTNRGLDAVVLFSGLVALCPYAAKYWRGLGVAFHRVLDLHSALGAYDAALELDDDHSETRCYRGEVNLYLGHHDAARDDLEAAKQSGRTELVRRAERLLAMLTGLTHWSPDQEPPAEPTSVHTTTFSLGDGRALPLAPDESRFVSPEHVKTEDTATAVSVAQPVIDFWEGAERTEPAITHLEAKVTALRDVTITDIVARPTAPKKERTETAVIPGRPRALALLKQQELPDVDSADEKTETAVVMRRRRRALVPYKHQNEGEG